MSGTIRLTAAQAMMRWLSVQMTEDGERFIEGVWAIFGHGNVAGIGEALHGIGDALPTWRGQNEQTMAHAAIAYAKTKRRRRAHAVTSSIGPGSTNMVTAAALAHVNRLPVLFICGDVFANRRPDPVLQQIEDFDDGTVSANDCFKPVTRYFDRISRPEHILTALPRALRTMTDPADCGPVCLAFCQDVQAEAYDYPESFFEPRVWRIRRPEPDPVEVAEVVAAIRAAKAPVIVSGGGVLYSGAEDLLADFAARRNIPIVETQAGKGATELGAPDELRLARRHRLGLRQRRLRGGRPRHRRRHPLPGLHHRLVDGLRQPRPQARLDQRPRLRRAQARRDRRRRRREGDAREDRRRPRRPRFAAADAKARTDWHATVAEVTAAPAKDTNTLPSDAQVIGAVQRVATENTVAMCAAGTMPGALQVLWQAAKGGYHMEYGYSCMGYEVAGAMGIKLADP